jgi:hypothetical protein
MGVADALLIEVLRLWQKRVTTTPEVDIPAKGGQSGISEAESFVLGVRFHYLQFGGSKSVMLFAHACGRILHQGSYAAFHDLKN